VQCMLLSSGLEGAKELGVSGVRIAWGAKELQSEFTEHIIILLFVKLSWLINIFNNIFIKSLTVIYFKFRQFSK
jgi:hypothetical protein